MRRSREGTVSFTRRECQILELLIDGHGYKEIGARLGISGATVAHRVYHLLAGLDFHSRPELQAWAERNRKAWLDGNAG